MLTSNFPQVHWATWRRPSPTLPATTWVQPCSLCWFGWCLLRLRSVCLRSLHCQESETSSLPWWKWPRRLQRWNIVKLHKSHITYFCSCALRRMYRTFGVWNVIMPRSPIPGYAFNALSVTLSSHLLPGLRNLWPSPPVHDPNTNKRQCSVVLVHHHASQNQPLPFNGPIFCSFSTPGPPM